MVTKSFSLFGRELFRVERDREGNFNYNFISNDSFLNNENYLKTSLENPIIQTIIALRSKMISQMQITHLDKNGKEIENSTVLKLLKTPNFFQTQQDFLFQLVWFMSATGTNYIHQKKNGINGEVLAMYNLIPSDIDFNNIDKLDKHISTKADLKKFQDQVIKYKIENTTFDFKVSEIIPFYDLSNGLERNSLMRSPSRLKSISKTIENIDENLKSKNINLKMSQKYLATNQGVTNGVVPQLQDNDRSAIEKILYRKSLQVTNVPIKVQHLVTDFKRLFLDEMFSNDALTCLLAFEMSKDVLNYFSNGSTFENQIQATVNWIQNSVQTDADSILDSFSQQFGLFEKGEKLKGSFDHLPIMQSVMKTKIETFKLFQETLKLSKENGVLTEAELKQINDSMKLKLNL